MAGKMKKGGLGQGLGALLSTAADTDKSLGQAQSGVRELNISEIEPDKGQPRKNFDKEKIEALAESIREHGLIQPIIVTKTATGYKIIAGERRWRAARKAGLKTIPAIEREATPREIMELALIENLQREDLNPIEEAEAYEKLMTEYNVTQERLSSIVSKSRPAIANSLRLLNCDKPIRQMLINGQLTAGHARAILSLDNKDDRLALAKQVAEQGISVRQTELLAKRIQYKREEAAKPAAPVSSAEIFKASDIQAVQEKLKSSLGTKVKLDDKGGKGKIVIEYFSADERERLIEYLTEKKK